MFVSGGVLWRRMVINALCAVSMYEWLMAWTWLLKPRTSSGIKPAVRTRSATASPYARSTISFSTAVCLQYPTPCQSLFPKTLMAREDFRNGSLRIMERRFDRRSGRIIIPTKTGLRGTCGKFSKAPVDIRIVISSFRASRNVELSISLLFCNVLGSKSQFGIDEPRGAGHRLSLNQTTRGLHRVNN